MTTVGSPLSWTLFIALIMVLLALDLGVFHRKVHRIGFREATVWSIVWIIVAMLFNLLVYWWYGSKPAVEFFTGYIIERALSVDNIFVFLIVFSYFAVPAAFQHRVLFWGILGAVVMRALFILLGTVLITTFHWIIFIFGAFLVYTGLKIMVQKEIEVHPENNLVLRIFRRIVPIIPEYHGARFTLVRDGKRYFTPMLLVLLVIESTDVVFAVDSIPAIFAITKDPFIAFTSNIFAILGLRAMYFLLADIVHRFAYLKYGLGLVLVFVGLKMLISDFYKIDSGLSLVIVTVILATSMIYSWMRPPPQLKHDDVHPEPHPDTSTD